MFYRTNLPGWERALRVVAGVAIAVTAVAVEGWSLAGGVGVAAGVGAAVSGAIGFCPACAMFGRRSVEMSR